MTDNEIIKALECCKGYLTNDCAMCQNVEKYPRCNEFLNEIALDLINRQKSEIERLNSEVKEKTEAIKEFAEMYKTEVTKRYEDIAYQDLFFGVVDNLVKEMECEQYDNSTRL